MHQQFMLASAWSKTAMMLLSASYTEAHNFSHFEAALESCTVCPAVISAPAHAEYLSSGKGG